MSTLTKLVTYAEFRKMDFDDTGNNLYELLNGVIVQRASPTVQHQRIARRLVKAFEKYLDEKPAGELFFAPLDVVLNDCNAPQPDIIFIRNENIEVIDEGEQLVRGAPDILVEILSPDSIKRDRIEKKELYEKLAVREFWLVDPNNRSVEVYQLQDGVYRNFAFAAETGTVQSGVWEGFEIEAAGIFN